MPPFAISNPPNHSAGGLHLCQARVPPVCGEVACIPWCEPIQTRTSRRICILHVPGLRFLISRLLAPSGNMNGCIPRAVMSGLPARREEGDLATGQ